MPITVVFDPPLPSDSPEVFNSKAFSTLGDLNDWSTQANAVADQINDAQPNLDIVAGNIANINAAVADLPALSAKVSKTGDTMTGPLSVPAGASGAQVPQAQEVGALANAQLTTHYKRSNVIGTVSQSGGVPTGAVIEKGSNANGSYVRFADGTQICWHTVTTSGTAGIFWIFPVAFASEPAVAYLGSSATVSVVTTFSNLISTSVDLHGWGSSGSRQAAVNKVVSFGRWF